MTDRSVQRQLLRTALATHIEENGARGVEPLIDRYKELTAPSAADVSALRTAAAEDVASRAGHRIEVYKNAGGVGLEAHVFAPAVRPDHSLPALIWFHGGSWSTGAWSFCPLVCRLAKELGFVVIQIEYRTDERFAGSPLNAMADARDALAWVRARAVDLDIDADRIVVSGFSAGGALAAQLATMSPARHVRAALLISACVSPWGDTWFRRMVEDRVREADVSPIAHLDSLDPNVLSIHGDADEMCPHADVVAFVAAAARVGIGSRLVTISKGHHFFVFESPADRATATDAARAFLTPLSPSSDRSRRLDHE